RILNASRQYLQQDFVVNAVKKLPYIALERIAFARAVAAHGAEHICQSFYAFVRAFADAAGERIGDKAGLEHRVELLENGVMQNSIAHRRFVNVPQLRVGDIKGGVGAVLVRFTSEFAMQLKN